MKFQIITIGKKHDKNLEDFIKDFEKRIKAHFDLEWTILNSIDDNNKEVQIRKESEKILEILEKASKNSFVILLDENGKEKSTKDLTNLFEEKMNEGIEKIIFIIGGAFSVSEDIFKKSDFVLSLSKLVFPHQLVRVILIEQIYRCVSILKNGKYHHE
jgi:23S rRNA (pseudouridine1915-N3)-methyltransferase